MINKKIVTAALLVLGVLFAASMLAFSNNEEPAAAPIDQANVVKKVIPIEGMTCESCEATVEKAAEKLSGLVSIEASAAEKRAIVEFDATQTSVEQISQAISSTGYTPLEAEEFTDAQKEEEAAATSDNRCGAGKCGAGKCGGAE